MKKKNVFLGMAMCTFVGTFVFISTLFSYAESAETASCSHNYGVDKKVVGYCSDIFSLHNMRVICVLGSGVTCNAGDCQCNQGDPHLLDNIQ